MSVHLVSSLCSPDQYWYLVQRPSQVAAMAMLTSAWLRLSGIQCPRNLASLLPVAPPLHRVPPTRMQLWLSSTLSNHGSQAHTALRHVVRRCLYFSKSNLAHSRNLIFPSNELEFRQQCIFQKLQWLAIVKCTEKGINKATYVYVQQQR